MDFKVAGTRQGITALQMDIKVGGVSIAMMREALAQARKARLEILDTMDQTTQHAPSGDFGLRAASVHADDSHGQDPRPDRARRKEDPLHHRSDRREDRRDG